MEAEELGRAARARDRDNLESICLHNCASVIVFDMASKRLTSRLQQNLRMEVFKALGDERRLEVFMRLACSSRTLTVSEITDCCGIHISGVSRHLAILRDAGLVRAEKVGREVRYRLDACEVTASLRRLADALDECRDPWSGEER